MISIINILEYNEKYLCIKVIFKIVSLKVSKIAFNKISDFHFCIAKYMNYYLLKDLVNKPQK